MTQLGRVAGGARRPPRRARHRALRRRPATRRSAARADVTRSTSPATTTSACPATTASWPPPARPSSATGRSATASPARHRHPGPPRRPRGAPWPAHRASRARSSSRPGMPPTSAVLTALSGRGRRDPLDAHVHASLARRGPHVAGAARRPSPHNDADALDRELARGRRPAGPGRWSSRSTPCSATPRPLRAAGRRSAHRHDALLVVDEAHGLGVAGRGRGLVHELGLVGRPHVVVTLTLSKALGIQGGAVLGPTSGASTTSSTRRGRFIFDTGLAPASAGAACAAAGLVARRPEPGGRGPRQRRHHRRRSVASSQAAGAVPVAADAVARGRRRRGLELRAQGVLVGCFRPPSVPDGVSRLRVTARADLSGDDLYEAARLVARAAATHGEAPGPGTVEGPRAGDAPSPSVASRRSRPSRVCSHRRHRRHSGPSPRTATMTEVHLPARRRRHGHRHRRRQDRRDGGRRRHGTGRGTAASRHTSPRRPGWHPASRETWPRWSA